MMKPIRLVKKTKMVNPCCEMQAVRMDESWSTADSKHGYTAL
jgi:hypothetical protein